MSVVLKFSKTTPGLGRKVVRILTYDWQISYYALVFNFPESRDVRTVQHPSARVSGERLRGDKVTKKKNPLTTLADRFLLSQHFKREYFIVKLKFLKLIHQKGFKCDHLISTSSSILTKFGSGVVLASY